MKHNILFIIGVLCTLFTSAQNPKWFKKARKSQFTIYAYNDANLMKEGQGIYLSTTGYAATEYDLLKGAVKANLVDAEGKQYDVSLIEGTSSLYNVTKLQTTNAKAAVPTLADNRLAIGETVYVLPPCSTDKNALCQTDRIIKVDNFGEANYPYYQLSQPYEPRWANCPVFSEDGKLVGMLQLASNGKDKPAYVLGIGYVNDMQMAALGANNNDLNSIGIQKALPSDESQASTYLYLMNKQNVEAYQKQVDAFIQKFPSSSNGYIQLAEVQVANLQFKEAEETYNKALSMKPTNEDEVHHAFAKHLYQVGLLDTVLCEGWNMQRALEEAKAADACNPQPLYKALEGLCQYALKDYQSAYDNFISLSQSNLRSADYFLYASQCKQMLNASNEEILALQDSAINCYTKPYPTEAAGVLYLRAQTYAKMDRNRDAINDLNEYEHLASGNVNSNFYYDREQLEMKAHLFSNALSDIERACSQSPKEPLFQAEKAVVNYRVGQLDEAIKACREAIRLDDTFTDAHRILGVCLRDKGQTAEAKKELKRAVEQGDQSSANILEKMK